MKNSSSRLHRGVRWNRDGGSRARYGAAHKFGIRRAVAPNTLRKPRALWCSATNDVASWPQYEEREGESLIDSLFDRFSFDLVRVDYCDVWLHSLVERRLFQTINMFGYH